MNDKSNALDNDSAVFRAMIEVMRPGQWVKNLLVMAGFFFALGDKTNTLDLKAAFLRTLLAFVLFCLVSGAVYVMNDLHDVEEDRTHPIKRMRPIASGRLPGRTAVSWYFALLAAALAGSLLLGRGFALSVSVYFLLQTLYTYWLKRVVVAELIVVAAGFVIRVYAGTAAAGIYASPWLLICTFMAALFLVTGKRREEKALLGDSAGTHRAVLALYDLPMLDHCISATAGATVVCYSIYATAGDTAAKFGTELMVLTVPFVVFGIFRYMYLVLCRGKGGSPERTLTSDVPTVINIVLYAMVYFCVMVLA